MKRRFSFITASVSLLATAQMGCSGKNSISRSAGSDTDPGSGTHSGDDSYVDKQAGTVPIAVTATNLVEATYQHSSTACTITTGGTGMAIGVHCYIQQLVNGVNRPADVKGRGFDVAYQSIADKNGQTLAGLTPILAKTGLVATYQFRAGDAVFYDLSVVSVTVLLSDTIKLVSRLEEVKISSPAKIDCPGGYVGIPENSTPGINTAAFCVMKYEAKNFLGGASSQAGGTPWVDINRADAINACQTSGAEMLTNAEWQAIARNIEAVAANWKNGVVGDDQLNRGHSDNSPSDALGAPTTDAEACEGTGQSCDQTEWNSQRRTHTLSTGEVIWDIAGNVWEWVSDDNTARQCDGAADFHISRIPASVCTASANPFKWLPSGDYSALSSDPFGGLGKLYDGSDGAVLRGGNFGVGAGVFSALLLNAASNTGNGVGFRCRLPAQ